MAGIFSDFPFMVPETTTGESYSGFIRIRDNDWFVRVSLPDREQEKAKGKNGIRLECGWRLAEILAPHQESLEHRLQQSASLHGYLIELRTAMQSILPSELRHRMRDLMTTEREEDLPSVALYKLLVDELNVIGWDHLTTMAADLRNVGLHANDKAGRRHELRLSLPIRYPQVGPTCITDLPIPLQLKWPSTGGNLSLILDQFQAALDTYQPLWKALDEIDENTWVLEPNPKSYKHCNRRIVIDEQSSLMLELNSQNPSERPECRFLGPQHAAQTYRKLWSMAASAWNMSISPLKNLQTVLKVSFPSPTTSKKEDFSVECGICYSFQLGTAVPNRVCENSKCGRPFHDECLYEWLRGLPNTRQSFNTLFGDCPYCSEQITVKVVSGQQL